MKGALRTILVLLAVMFAGMPETAAQQIIRKKDLVVDSIKQVVIGHDTVDFVIPERNFGRFDRGLRNYIFIPKGKWGFGVTASYGELQTEDIRVLSLLKDLNLKGKIYSIKPYVQYAVRNNQAVGLKFDYSRGTADLGKLAVDFDEDLNFTLADVSYYQQTFAVAAIYRAYVGLDPNGRFGIFNETDLSFGSGSSRFKRLYNAEPRDTRTLITQGSLNFSPGVCVFIQDFVSFNVSFGVFGLKWRHESQSTNGEDEGSRTTSGANFRFNIFNINFGLMIVI